MSAASKTPQTMGERIKHQREALSLSPSEFAALIDHDKSAISRWENNNRRPHKAFLPILAEALETSVEFLTSGKAARLDSYLPNIPFHPLADLFPLLDAAGFDSLVTDMTANGFRPGKEIVIHDGKILDGRNRCRAAIAAGIIPTNVAVGKFDLPQYFRAFGSRPGEVDEVQFVFAENLNRRHLNASQRAMAGAKLAAFPPGRPPEHGLLNEGVSGHAAAKLLNVGLSSVERARSVVKRATPEVASAVTRGEVSLNQAVHLADLPPEQQRDIIKSADPKVLRVITSQISIAERAAKTEAKKARRAEREAGLATKQLALPGQYGVIYADPEWKFETRSEKGMDRSADNHYPCSELEVIKARLETDFEADIRAKDCVLFLWATVPCLAQAFAVIEAWGFTYVSSFAWTKPHVGNGYWNRNKHEILLVATRGRVVAPAMGDQFDSAIEAPVGKHSQKPEIFAEIIETYYPNLPKIELNARTARKGWTSVIHDPVAGQEIISPDGEVIG